MEPSELKLIAGGIAIFAAIFLAGWFYEKKRTETLQKTAKKLGLLFQKSWTVNIDEAFKEFVLFSKGYSKKLKNRMHARRNRVDVSIFGYSYTVGGGKNSNTYTQTVILFESDDFNFTGFELSPENFFHKIGQLFNYQDIDFKTHSQFSKKYLLRGKDEEKIRQLFSPKILDYFEKHKGYSIEANGKKLICYKHDKRIKPDNMQAFLREGEHILQIFIK